MPPIKRSPYLVQLSKEHHSGLLFCWKIRQGLKKNADTERIRKYVQYFWEQDLMAHFREEEEILFVLKDDEKTEMALREHAQIKSIINSLKETRSADANQLNALADAVDNHIRYEERELFPYLETKFTEEQLVKIGEQLSAQPSHGDRYGDEFWV